MCQYVLLLPKFKSSPKDVPRCHAIHSRHSHPKRPQQRAHTYCGTSSFPTIGRPNVCLTFATVFGASLTINRSWQLSPKQDHLVCFLGGSLMLGATTTESIVSLVSTPPLARELTEAGQKDWKLGVELINTCMDTHETAT